MSTNSTSEPRELTETPDLNGAYPRLDEAGIAALAPLGRRRRVQPEEVLFREGDRDCQFFVVLAGMVASVEGYGTAEENVISVHGRGRFLGELSLLTGEGSYYTAVAAEEGEVLAVPAGRLRELVARDQGIGDLILRAYLIRRSILIGLGAGLRIIGSRYSPDARRVRDFAARNRLPYRWLDLDSDPGAEALLARFGVAPQDTPIVILHGRMLRNPGNAELAAAAGLPAPSASAARCDLLVVGSGPGGMSAAVYGASEGLRTMVLDGTATGGQAGTSSRIENYLGFPSGVSGAELAERAMLQARKFGAEFVVPAEAASIEEDGGQYLVRLTDGSPVTATSVVIATGARYRRLDVPRLDHFEKTSVYYAASQAEALLCAGDPVAIVGGGNSAGQAAVFLSGHAAQVTLIAREHDLTGGTRVLLAVLGVLSLIIGLYAVRHVLVTLLALALLLGIYWIVNGAVELFMALSARGVPGRGWTVVMGVLSVLAGLLVLVYPAISLLTLVVVLSVWLLVLGLMEITLAIRARSAGRRIEHRELHPV